MNAAILINDIDKDIHATYIKIMPKYIGLRVLPRIPSSIRFVGGSCDLNRVLCDICMKESAVINITMNKIKRKINGT